MARRRGWASQLRPGAESGPLVGYWQGAPAMLLLWRHGGEPWHGVVVPGEPCWRWIHFHRFFLVFRWIHLRGLHTISHMSNGLCYHAADGAPPLMPPPLPLWRLQPSLFSPTQRWAAIRLADLGPLASKHSWHERASKLSELWASCQGPCVYRTWNKWQWGGSLHQEATVMAMHVAKDGCSGSWGAYGLKGPLLWEEEEGRGG